MPSDKNVSQEALLEEYKSCHERAGRLDDLMWQTAAIFYPVSLAGFAFFGIASTHTTEQFLVVLATGIGSITLLITWYFLSARWYGFQKLAYHRMREIEPILGLWQYRYAEFIKLTQSERQNALNNMDESEHERFEVLDNLFADFSRFGLHRAMKLITVLFVLGWIALILREFVLAF